MASRQTSNPQRTRVRSCGPPAKQSVAALLPEEILDSIFAQLGLDYSTHARPEDRMQRDHSLSNVSVVAEGWLKPARRLLARRVRILGWTHLQEEVEEGLGKQLRDLDIQGYYREAVTSQEAADAVFRLLKRLPNLRRLRLAGIPCDSFNPIDSSSMHAAVLIPHLHDLNIFLIPFPHSLIVDLLATSGHRIDRLSVDDTSGPVAPHAVYRQIDFRGKLRFLSTGSSFYRTLVDPRLVALEGLKGLEELQLQGIGPRSTEGGEETYHVIAPTLRTLRINCNDVTLFAKILSLFSILSRLLITGFHSPDDADPTPLLRSLPSSLSALRLDNDEQLGPSLARWTAAPSLVPARLKQIQIDYIQNYETYQQLPLVPTLRTNYRSTTLNHLQRLSPATVPFKTLEMRFYDSHLNRRSDVEAQCRRLGVIFRQRLQYRDA